MPYTIINSYIPTSLYPLKATYPMMPEFITIHNTFNDATAANEIAYMTRNTASTSYHVAVDDKHVIQAIPFNRNAWHAGDGQGKGNRASIGIEICYSKSGGQKYVAAEENTIEYVAHILKQHGWGIDRVKWHRDWSGKNCPHRIFAEGRADEVLKRISVRLAILNGVASTQTPPKKEEVEMFKPSSATLKNSVINYLEQAANDKIVDGKWAAQAKSGTLLLDDALALHVEIESRRKVITK